MTCEKHKDALIDAAAGEPIDRRLADHLEDCTPCRATLSREQDLFIAIDDALRARVSKTPRAGFLASVHTQIALEALKQDAQKQDAHAQSRWNPMWTWAGAAALALVLVVIGRPWGRLQQPPVTAESAKAPDLRAHESPAMAQPVRGPAGHLRTEQDARLESAPPLRAQTTAAEQPATVESEVLVPPDEAKAFALFVAHVAARDWRAEAVVRRMRGEAEGEQKQLLEIQAVDIADLVWEPQSWDWK